MNGPKLFHVLLSFSDEEWTSYKKFLLQHTRADATNYKLIQVLFSNRKKLGQEDFDKTVKAKHFPDIKPKPFSNILSKLFSWLEDWLAIDTFRNQRYAPELQIIKAYNERGLFKLANRTAEKLEAKIKAESHIDMDMNRALNQLYHNQYYSSNPIKRRKGTTLFKDCVTHFIYTTKEYASGYLMEIENQSLVRGLQHEVLNEALQGFMLTEPASVLSDLFSKAYKMFSNNDLDAYLKVLSMLESEIVSPSSDLFLILSIYLRRVSIELYQQKEIKVEQVVAAHQLSFLATSENKNQKFLSMNLFNGVGVLGTMMSYEETESFIYKWIDKVYTDNKESTLKWCKVLNAFRHDLYEPIPELMQGLKFDLARTKITSQLILIIAHYKLGEEALALTLIQNFKKQLKRNVSNIAPINFLKIENLIEIIELLIKSRYDKTIVINLDDYKTVFYRSWVKKQLEKASS